MFELEEQLRDFANELRRDFSGEIHLDRFTRLIYSTDASIYQIEPLGVLFPRNHNDVSAAISTAALHKLPILSRGAGTSLAGQTVGASLVVDYTKYMNRILEVSPEEGTARVEPGVVLDQLNGRLRTAGAQFGPDVSTSNRATLGGMVGNNSAGAHSVLYGMTIDHVREVRAILSSGLVAHFSELSPYEWQLKMARDTGEGQLYGRVDRIVRENREEVIRRYPSIMRRVGGYNLDAFVTGNGWNLSRMIIGSEGTLAAVTEVLVDIVPLPKVKALSILHFDDLVAAMDATGPILEKKPAAVELVDKMLLDLTRLQPAFATKMTFIEGDPEAILVVEFYGDTTQEVENKLSDLEGWLSAQGLRAVSVRAVSPEDQANVWAIRKAGLGLLSSMRGDSKPIAFVEDSAVAPEKLGQFVSRFKQILDRHDTRAGYYGHASVGCLHIRPIINLKDTNQIRKMTDIAAAVKDLVVEFNGAMSGEHGDGLARSHWNRELFGDQLYKAFGQIKSAFDPVGIMNPGKIIDAPPMDTNLRYGPGYSAIDIPTHLDFSDQGGLSGAIEQCNGMGACRKTSVGTMCPSYRATGDEEHSTRGRANALRAAISGKLDEEGYTGERLHSALDLCLECKACKTECPANVDMAKLKYEFLAHYQAHHGIPLRSRIFGNIAQISRIGSALAPVSNWVLGSRLTRKLVQPMVGVHPNRSLPPFAAETFRSWLRRHPVAQEGSSAQKVVFFTDTFVNHNEPGLGRAALKLLESSGANISIPEVACCGRPMISKGLLNQAMENAKKNIAILTPLVEAGAFIVGCEPSCILTLRDEYPDLLRTEAARRVAERVMLLEEFLLHQIEAGFWAPRFALTERSILVHGHCHQKSLVGTSPLMRLLRMPPNFTVEEVDSGCCGMAGSFGYEKEHYEISLRIGELSLFPAIRKTPQDTDIVASGLSCRQQILHATGRKALHFAEVLSGHLLQ